MDRGPSTRVGKPSVYGVARNSFPLSRDTRDYHAQRKGIRGMAGMYSVDIGATYSLVLMNKASSK